VALVVCHGDSLTYGYPYGPEASWVNRIPELYGYKAINRGINGNTTAEMYARFTQHVIAHKPDYVIITGGANDVFWRESIDSIIHNYLLMIEAAMAVEITPILGLTPPVDEPEMENRLHRLRDRIKEIAYAKALQVIDFCPPFYDNEGRIRGELFLDGAHPTREGYRLMGDCLPPSLE